MVLFFGIICIPYTSPIDPFKQNFPTTIHGIPFRGGKKGVSVSGRPDSWINMWHVLNTHMFFHVFGERQLMGLNHHINHHINNN